MPLSVNDLPAELLVKIFLEGTRTELAEEEGAWEDEESDYESADGSTSNSDSDGDSDSHSGSEAYSLRIRGTKRDGAFGDKNSTPEFPTLISHVCHHWRSVALNVPMLWTVLDFSEGPPYEKSKTWLERSKDCDLDITIDFTKDDEDEDDYRLRNEKESSFPKEDLRKIMNLIAGHIYRWSVLHISVSSKDHMDMVLHQYLFRAGPAPRLRSLSLYDNSESDEPNDEQAPPDRDRDQDGILFENQAPLLIKTCFWGVSLNWKKNTILSGLEALELAYHEPWRWPSWEDFTFLLLASPDLKNLSLADSGPDPSDDLQVNWPTDPIPLHSLRGLSLSFLTPGYVAELLQRLEIPFLEEFELDLEEGEESNLISNCLTGKKSILRHVRKFKISSLQGKPNDVRDIYSHLPVLNALCINLHYLSALYLTLLSETTENGKSPTYLPQLEELTVMGSDDHIPSLKQVISTRKEGGVGIKRLILCEQDAILDEDLGWFKSRVETVELVDNADDEEVTDSDSDGIPIQVDDIWELGLGLEEGD